MTLARRIDPATILTQVKPMNDAIAAFEAFDRREHGWIMVELHPQQAHDRGQGDEERLSGEQLLDEAINETFPASDPVSPAQRQRR
jgi:hypothetical protein